MLLMHLYRPFHKACLLNQSSVRLAQHYCLQEKEENSQFLLSVLLAHNSLFSVPTIVALRMLRNTSLSGFYFKHPFMGPDVYDTV